MPPRKPVLVDYSVVGQEPWLKDLLSKLDRPKFKLDNSVQEELKKISSRAREKFAANGRPRLPVVRTKADMAELMDENSVCLADRDRVTEILVSYTAIRYALDALWEQAEARLLENETFSQLGNAPARSAFISAVLKPVADKRHKVKQVLSMCEVMQEHLSHTHFAIQHHAKMGETLLGLRSA